jgi:dihydroorotate dehydrogenase electron transfer subunit
MKKFVDDFAILENVRLNDHYILLKLKHPSTLPEMAPGQFVEIRIDNTSEVLLRRPISINFVDKVNQVLWLLIQLVGKGTYHLASLKDGDTVNLIYPLGKGFTIPEVSGPIERLKSSDRSLLLVGGGAGTAPLLFLGEQLYEKGFHPSFLLGARSKNDLFQLDDFARYGDVYTATEDGSMGEKGFVTQHSLLNRMTFGCIYACGPKPMMMAVAKYAKDKGIDCEVSLENKMACGLGACLCCVEDTEYGNLCVCKEGPVFNINKLLWQI